MREDVLAYLELMQMAGVRFVLRGDEASTGAAEEAPEARTPEPAVSKPAPSQPPASPKSRGEPAGTAIPSSDSDVRYAEPDLPPRPRESLEEIRKFIGDCERCKLSQGRRSLVFGDGNPDADLLFVGEGPGADEDRQGLPFVGAAGQLLNKIIGAMGYEREQVYICNIVKCRPPDNRTPEEDEIRTCTPFVIRQIESVKPRVVCALGATAAQTITDSREPMRKMRGQLRPIRIGDLETRFMATYHPAYLLRSPHAKKLVWEDVQKIMAFLRD